MKASDPETSQICFDELPVTRLYFYRVFSGNKSMFLLNAAGYLSLGLGFLGIFLPVLPTTPFVLLAAACFAKSSPRMHKWLHRSSLFGESLQRWETHRCISRRNKAVAVASIVVFGGSSLIFAVPTLIGQVVTGILLLTGLTVVLRIKTCHACQTHSWSRSWS